MAGEWREATVGGIASSARNALVGGPFGSNLISSDYIGDGVPVIRGQNMGARWVSGDFAFVSPAKAASLEPNLARPGDIVFTQRGTIGQVCVIPKKPFDRYLVSQSQMKLTVNSEIADPLFFYYVFSGTKHQGYIRQQAIQTGVPHTNLGILRETRVPLPPLPEQRAIAYILGTLDDKIELNRRMNETLEAMARALFKSWFVDFDPVRAKAEGRGPGLPPNIADLFPDSFENSELGPIPSGWVLGSLVDLADLNSETWNRATRPEVIQYLDLSNVKRGKIESVVTYRQKDAPSRAQRVLRPGDTIVGTVRPANCSYALIADEGLTGSTGFASLRPRAAVNREIVYLAATASENIEDLAHLADGAAYPAVRPEVVASTRVVLPGGEILAHFSAITASQTTRIAHNDQESRTLAALRDTLLPKLISGQLRVKDAGQGA